MEEDSVLKDYERFVESLEEQNQILFVRLITLKLYAEQVWINTLGFIFITIPAVVLYPVWGILLDIIIKLRLRSLNGKQK